MGYSGKSHNLKLMKSGNNSVVECNLAKVEVASSNLVSRSIYFTSFLTSLFSTVRAEWPEYTMCYCKIVMIGLLLLVMPSCSKIHLTQTHKYIYLPSRPSDVEVLLTVPQDRHYIELAALTVTEYEAAEVKDLYVELRERSAPLGAQGVIVLNQDIKPDGTMWLTAVAVRWKNP